MQAVKAVLGDLQGRLAISEEWFIILVMAWVAVTGLAAWKQWSESGGWWGWPTVEWVDTKKMKGQVGGSMAAGGWKIPRSLAWSASAVMCAALVWWPKAWA